MKGNDNSTASELTGAILIGSPFCYKVSHDILLNSLYTAWVRRPSSFMSQRFADDFGQVPFRQPELSAYRSRRLQAPIYQLFDLTNTYMYISLCPSHVQLHRQPLQALLLELHLPSVYLRLLVFSAVLWETTSAGRWW